MYTHLYGRLSCVGVLAVLQILVLQPRALLHNLGATRGVQGRSIWSTACTLPERTLQDLDPQNCASEKVRDLICLFCSGT